MISASKLSKDEQVSSYFCRCEKNVSIAQFLQSNRKSLVYVSSVLNKNIGFSSFFLRIFIVLRC